MKTSSTKKKNFIIPIVIVTIIVVAIAYVLYNNKQEINKNAAVVPQGVSATPVKVASVTSSTIDNALSFTGSFEARKTLPLVAEAQGSITQLNIREGQAVSNGQVIARIDATTLQSNLINCTGFL